MTCMKASVRFILTLLLGGAAIAAPLSWAHGPGHHHHHHHSRVGVYFGYAWLFPQPVYPQPRSYYFPPTVIVRPAEPQVYIERAAPQPQAYWHYCGNPQGYYPYVKECPGGWQQVVPTPPPN